MRTMTCKLDCDICNKVIEEYKVTSLNEVLPSHPLHVLNGKILCFNCAIDALNYLESKKDA